MDYSQKDMYMKRYFLCLLSLLMLIANASFAKEHDNIRKDLLSIEEQENAKRDLITTSADEVPKHVVTIVASGNGRISPRIGNTTLDYEIREETYQMEVLEGDSVSIFVSADSDYRIEHVWYNDTLDIRLGKGHGLTWNGYGDMYYENVFDAFYWEGCVTKDTKFSIQFEHMPVIHKLLMNVSDYGSVQIDNRYRTYVLTNNQWDYNIDEYDNLVVTLLPNENCHFVSLTQAESTNPDSPIDVTSQVVPSSDGTLRYVMESMTKDYVMTATFAQGAPDEPLGHDGDVFTATNADGLELKYMIISESEKTCQVGSKPEVGYSSSTDIANAVDGEIEGTVNIPEIANGYRVVKVGYQAFFHCGKITKINIPNSVTDIGYLALAGSGITSLTIPSSVTRFSWGALQECNNLISINVESGNSVYDSRENCNAVIETSSNTLVRGCRASTVPNGVTAIGHHAFDLIHSDGFSITLSNTVKTIGVQSFNSCSLAAITLSDSLTSVGYACFAGSQIEEIRIPASMQEIAAGGFCVGSLKRIISEVVTPFEAPEDAFENYETAVLYVPDSSLKTYRTTSPWNKFLDIRTIDSLEPEPYAVYQDGVLTFYYDDRKDFREGTVYELNGGYVNPGWYTDHRTDITKAVFDDSFAGARPTSTFLWFAVNYNETSNIKEIEGIQNLNTSNVTKMMSMFAYCSNLTSVDVSNFDTSNVTDMRSMFRCCNSLTSLDVSHFDTKNVTNMGYMFYGCSSLTSLDVSHFDTKNVTNMGYMFFGCSSLTNLDVNHFDTKNVTNMYYMFCSCSSLTSIDVSHFDTGSVTNISGIFEECSSLTNIDLSRFNTSNVTDIRYMFNGCSSLTSVDLSHLDTKNVTYMGAMFADCSSLTSVDLSHFDTSNVTGMGSMFTNCSSLTSVDLSHFNTSNVSIMDYMFYGCSSLTSVDLSHFDTSNVTNMKNMFYNCSNLSTIYCDDTWSCPSSTGMFYNCKSLPGYDSAHTSVEYAKPIDLGGYFTRSENNPNGIIDFADAEVKRICVENWDANGDVELSYGEAAAVTDLGQAFNSSKISSFDELQYFKGLSEIGQNAFRYSSIGHVVLPNGLKSLGVSSFSDCSNLKTIDFPSSLQEIKTDAFFYAGLTQIVIPKTIITIETEPFFACPIETITVDSENPYFDSRDNCHALIETATNRLIVGTAEAFIPNTVTTIGGGAFYGSNANRNRTNLEIPSSVVQIDRCILRGNTGMTSLHIPASVRYIDRKAFDGVKNVSIITVDADNNYYDSRNNCNAIIETATNTLIRGSIETTIPESVEKIANYAFYENNITSVVIPEGVKTIGYESFAFCYNLKNIEIPNSVTSIGDRAFSYSSNVEIIKVHIKKPFALNEKCFSGFSFYAVKENATLYVPYGTKSLYEQTDGWKDFKNIIEMDGDNSLYAFDFTIRPGAKKTIALKLDNENTFVAGEFRLQLPEGLSIETDMDGSLVANLVSGRINKHTLMVTDEGNGLYHFLFYSSQNRALVGNSGDFITLSVVADEGLEEGDYAAELKNVLFSTEEENRIDFPNITFSITVLNYTPGNVNGDDYLDVMDVVKLVNYIMGRNPSNFVFPAADIDENGKINVMDLVYILDIIMDAPLLSPAQGITTSAVRGLQLDTMDGNTIALSVPEAYNHIAAQFFVTLSGNAALKGVLTDNGHLSKFTRMEDGRYKVMVYSDRNDSFRSDNPIKLQLSGGCNVKIDDVVFVDATEEAVMYEPAMTNTTGIMAAESDFRQPVDVYTMDGKLVKKNATSMRGLAKGTYIVNKEKVSIK